MVEISPELPAVAFVLITHRLRAAIIREFAKLEASVAGLGTAWFLYQGEAGRRPRGLKIDTLEVVSRMDLQAMNYRMPFARIVPGSSHFPLLHFFHKHPDYRDYWLIEYDVRFSGSWGTFFREFARVPADFLAAHFRWYHQEPGWPFWELTHPDRSIALEERLRCFHPICRFSNSALACVDKAHREGWCGHDELLPPTILHRNGFSIVDFGGEGEFVPPGMKNRYYAAIPPNRKGRLESGTYRYRPAHLFAGFEKDKLYHPVKPWTDVAVEALRSCLYRLIGRQRTVRLVARLKSLLGLAP